MSVLIKIVLGWRRQNRGTDAVLDGREAMPENGTCPGPHRERPNSAGISQMSTFNLYLVNVSYAIGNQNGELTLNMK